MQSREPDVDVGSRVLSFSLVYGGRKRVGRELTLICFAVYKCISNLYSSQSTPGVTPSEIPYWPRRVVLASGCLRTITYVVGADIVVELWAQSCSPGCTVACL